ncbi:MAG: TRAP transporter small permease [Spirochaetales bacterium]|nr:TRAP transporter small permease [Spirochaetales bacterium]
MKRLITLSENIAKIVVSVSCITLSLVVVIIAVNVVGRAFDKPLPGGFDLSILCAAVSGSLAIAYTTKANAHVNVDIIINILPPSLKKVQEIISHLVTLFLFVILAWQAAVVFIERFVGEYTETLEIPYWPFRLIWLLSMGCSILFCIVQILILLTGGKEKWNQSL